jgi:hypothetical protein
MSAPALLAAAGDGAQGYGDSPNAAKKEAVSKRDQWNRVPCARAKRVLAQSHEKRKKNRKMWRRAADRWRFSRQLPVMNL